MKTAILGGGFVLLSKNQDKIALALKSVTSDNEVTSLT